MNVAPSLRFPVVGRATSGLVALALAVPLCRAAGITTDEALAKRVGRATALVDALGVAAVLASSGSTRQSRAAIANAAIDAAGVVALVGLATQRRGTERVANIAASVFLASGGLAWIRATRSLDEPAHTCLMESEGQARRADP